MPCRALTVLAGLALVGCASASAITGGAGPPPVAASGPQAERPIYTLGDRWIRSDGVFELIRVQDDAYVFASDGGTEIHLTKTLGLAKVVSGHNPVWGFEPAPQLAWPLAVGKRGSSRGTLMPYAGRTIPADLQWTVVAYEYVRVA